MTSLGGLFDREPMGYGMRGDTYLWKRLGKRLADVALPSSHFEVRNLVRAAILDEVGVDVDVRKGEFEGVFVKALSTGSGLSDGNISPNWWKMTGVPIIVDRWAAEAGR